MPSTQMLVPFFEPQHFYRQHQEAILKAFDAHLSQGTYIGGTAVSEFEAELATHTHRQFALGVGCGYDALTIALQASELKAGMRVVVPAFSFAATALAPLQLGLEVIYCDVEPQYAGLDAAKLLPILQQQKPDAVIYVPLFGQGPHALEIEQMCQQHKVLLIEDAAQAVGATINQRPLGSIGDISAVSFYPTKPLGGAGNGGAVLTNHYQKAHLAQKMAAFGSTDFVDFELPAYNSRLNALQAVFLKHKLRHLTQIIEHRTQIAQHYQEALAPLAHKNLIALPHTHPSSQSVHYCFVITTPLRTELKHHLKSQGIATAIHYPTPLHQLTANPPTAPEVPMPVAERLSQQALSLPLFYGMSHQQAQMVTQAIQSFFLKQQ